MNSTAEEGLMALLEAMLSLAAREARRPKPPPVKPGGFPEDQFLDLTENEKEEFACGICYQIIKETMQCVNNHKFCHSCLLVWSTTGQYANRIRCPVCRTHGYYFRNNEMDELIGAKKVKCHMESCSWSGLCKYLQSHRHTTYGEDNSPRNDTNSVSSIPRLAQASPRSLSNGTARFVGTGLTTRGSSDTSSTVSSMRTPLLAGRSAAQTNYNSVSSPSQETVHEIPTRASGPSSTSNTRPSRVPPVRNPGNNRITFSHRAPVRDSNNNVGGVSTSTSTRSSIPGVSDSSDSIANSVAAGFTPRPPSAPRSSSNAVNTRRLPRIVNPPPQTRPQGTRFQSSEVLPPSGRAAPAESLGEIRDRLQESRNRLDNLMSSFSGELDRSRQEMVEFQQERERQRREQLDEVRELGQRLGQVASELRRLLEQRRHVSSLSDDDDDDEDDDDDDE